MLIAVWDEHVVSVWDFITMIFYAFPGDTISGDETYNTILRETNTCFESSVWIFRLKIMVPAQRRS